MAEEDGLNSLFHNFISNYQKVYEQGSDNSNQENDDTGIVFNDYLLSFLIVIEIVILHSLRKKFFQLDLCECCTQLLPGGRSFRQLIDLFCHYDSPER